MIEKIIDYSVKKDYTPSPLRRGGRGRGFNLFYKFKFKWY